MQSHGVYILSSYPDDPRYEGFACDAGTDDLLAQARLTLDESKRIRTNRWQSPEVVGNVRLLNDYPTLLGFPAFSHRAVECLRDMLSPNGELLPLKSDCGSYFFFNVTNFVDALDERASEIQYFRSSPEKVLDVRRFVFKSEKLSSLSIFCIPQRPMHTFVTEPFKTRVEQCGLRGFVFRKVWPLPPDVDWRALSAEERRKHFRERDSL